MMGTLILKGLEIKQSWARAQNFDISAIAQFSSASAKKIFSVEELFNKDFILGIKFHFTCGKLNPVLKI